MCFTISDIYIYETSFQNLFVCYIFGLNYWSDLQCRNCELGIRQRKAKHKLITNVVAEYNFGQFWTRCIAFCIFHKQYNICKYQLMPCTIEQLSFSVNLCANFLYYPCAALLDASKIKFRSMNLTHRHSKWQLLKHSLSVNVFHESGQYFVILWKWEILQCVHHF